VAVSGGESDIFIEKVAEEVNPVGLSLALSLSWSADIWLVASRNSAKMVYFC